MIGRIPIRMVLCIVSCPCLWFSLGSRTLIRTANASSGRSFEHSHRRLSGRRNIRANWITGITACMATGILHAASVVYLTVPKTVHAAIIDPTYCKYCQWYLMPRLIFSSHREDIPIECCTYEGIQQCNSNSEQFLTLW